MAWSDPAETISLGLLKLAFRKVNFSALKHPDLFVFLFLLPCSSSWPYTHNDLLAPGPCLLRAGIKGVCHHAQPQTLMFKRNIFYLFWHSFYRNVAKLGGSSHPSPSSRSSRGDHPVSKVYWLKRNQPRAGEMSPWRRSAVCLRSYQRACASYIRAVTSVTGLVFVCLFACFIMKLLFFLFLFFILLFLCLFACLLVLRQSLFTQSWLSWNSL